MTGQGLGVFKQEPWDIQSVALRLYFDHKASSMCLGPPVLNGTTTQNCSLETMQMAN